MAQLNPESLPAIRLLMREMEVAVSDEDYEQAARLRDHPWMRLAEDINMHWCAQDRARRTWSGEGEGGGASKPLCPFG